MTLYELKKNILLKLDEYESDYDTSEHEYAMTDDEDIITKLPFVINEAIRFAFYGKSYKERWNITQGSSFNALETTEAEHRTGVTTDEPTRGDITFEADEGYGYYFEVDDTATIRVETSSDGENWSLAKTITATATEDYNEIMSFKGIVGAGLHLRLVFSGAYYYKIHNVCIYNVLFSDEKRIPEYNGYHTHKIPSGLYKVDRVYMLGDEKKPIDFRVKGDLLYLPDIEGEFEIESTFFPDLITATTDKDTVLDVPKDIEYIIVQKACAFLSQEGEYEEFISDSEQGMQMLETDRGHSAPVIRRFW